MHLSKNKAQKIKNIWLYYQQWSYTQVTLEDLPNSFKFASNGH